MEPIRAYLRDLKHVPRLTAEEEIRLARRAKRGDQEARRIMIHANLPLVINMAKKYRYLGVPFVDLIEEGNIGLMRAVVKFNPNRGYRFSTYAAWWIRQYIIRAIANQARVVRVPVYMGEMINKWRKVTERLSHKLGRRPTEREVAKEMDITIRKVKEIKEVAVRSSSLDRTVIREGGSAFVDLLEDRKAHTSADELVRLLRHEKIAELLGLMQERERRILGMRFGFGSGVTHSLGEVAARFKLSRERIHQLEQRALRKLRRLLSSPKEIQALVEAQKKIREEEKKELGRKRIRQTKSLRRTRPVKRIRSASRRRQEKQKKQTRALRGTRATKGKRRKR